MTSSIWVIMWRSQVHSSMYILISTSNSAIRVFLILRFNHPISSSFTCMPAFRSQIWRFRALVKCVLFLKFSNGRLVFDDPDVLLLYPCCTDSISSIKRSFLASSASILVIWVLSFMFSSTMLLFIHFKLRASSYNACYCQSRLPYLFICVWDHDGYSSLVILYSAQSRHCLGSWHPDPFQFLNHGNSVTYQSYGYMSMGLLFMNDGRSRSVHIELLLCESHLFRQIHLLRIV